MLGAVAAEASEWGLGVVSPPLKRANSLPVSPPAWQLPPRCWCCCGVQAAQHRACRQLAVCGWRSPGQPGRSAGCLAAQPAPPASPPCASLLAQPGLDASKCGGAPRGCKVSDRVALLKRALAGETVAVAAAQQKKMGGGLPLGVDGGAPTAEDADAVSALFELSSSMC